MSTPKIIDNFYKSILTWSMPIDSKYLKLKLKPGKSGTTTASFTVPSHVLKYLQERGVNTSEVCRSALEEALKHPNVESKGVRSTFKVSADLLNKAARVGINISDTCARALEAIYIELKGEGTKRS